MVPSENPSERHEGRLVDHNSGTPIKYACLYRKFLVLGSMSSTLILRETATALGKLGHPDGELNLTRAAAKHGVIQMVCAFSDIGCARNNNSLDPYPCLLLLR